MSDPHSPYKELYQQENVLTLSDWYHRMMPDLIRNEFLTDKNPTGREPVPDAALMNDTQNLNMTVQRGQTYLFHIVNMSAFAAHYFWIEDHMMHIVEVDGVYTQRSKAKMLYIAAGQRYAVLVEMNSDKESNFAFHNSMDKVCKVL